MAINLNRIEDRLWQAADELRANSKLKSAEYSVPVLGLIFLRFADYKFSWAEYELIDRFPAASSRRRTLSKLDYQARGVMYLPDEARWSRLIQLAESANIGKAINDAMRAIETENDDLKYVLPKTLLLWEKANHQELLRTLADRGHERSKAFYPVAQRSRRRCPTRARRKSCSTAFRWGRERIQDEVVKVARQGKMFE